MSLVCVGKSCACVYACANMCVNGGSSTLNMAPHSVSGGEGGRGGIVASWERVWIPALFVPVC